jgi:hypothetical protein
MGYQSSIHHKSIHTSDIDHTIENQWQCLLLIITNKNPNLGIAAIATIKTVGTVSTTNTQNNNKNKDQNGSQIEMDSENQFEVH